MSFDGFGLHPTLAANVQSVGYVVPTPIQAQSIPPVMQGRDLMGLAQTGTGKTAAFLLPILHRLATTGPRGRLRALILAPTRELAAQIHDAAGELGRNTPSRSVAIFGGVSMVQQLRSLRQSPEIAVACPGRLLDHLGRNTIETTSIEFLVVDEADRMFDMGFLPDVRKVIARLPRQRQTLMYSATMPDEVRALAQEALCDPVTIEVGPRTPIETVVHRIFPVSQPRKADLLTHLLRQTPTESVLIFTRTKHRARRLAQQLMAAGFEATSLQGNLSQSRRRAAIDGFRQGRYRVLVATDIAARGIDVSSISHVINFDMPDTVDAYTHRVGRTGRATRAGDALSLVTPDDMPTVRAIERAMGCQIESQSLPDFQAAAGSPQSQPPRPVGPPRRHCGKPTYPRQGANLNRSDESRPPTDAIPRAAPNAAGGRRDNPHARRRDGNRPPTDAPARGAPHAPRHEGPPGRHGRRTFALPTRTHGVPASGPKREAVSAFPGRRPVAEQPRLTSHERPVAAANRPGHGPRPPKADRRQGPPPRASHNPPRQGFRQRVTSMLSHWGTALRG